MPPRSAPDPRPEPDGQPWDAVVFSGGGCRCFWEAGFWSEAAPALGLRPRVVGAVSAGAAMACAVFGSEPKAVVDDFKARAAANARNSYPANLLRGEPVFPHEQMYRDTILAATTPESLARLHRGPDLRVLLGRPPKWAGPASTIALGLVGSRAERWLAGGVHAVWGRRVGFEPEVVSARTCRTPEELAELVLHSSCTPPALPLYRRGGQLVVDGGIVDGVPVEAVEPARSVLVLLSRHRPAEEIPRVPGRTYVGPSQPIPVDIWDYTDPEGVQATWDLGRRDGEAFVRAAEGGLDAAGADGLRVA